MEEFLNRVMPWPGEKSPGYVAIHYLIPGGGMPGKPCRTAAEFVKKALWHVQQLKHDVYFCTALLDKVGIDKNKNQASNRKTDNALYQKSLHADIDVKPGGYNTVEEALDALADFCESIKLPFPNWINGSGSGLHVYWITSVPMEMDYWDRLSVALSTAMTAHGLKFDSGCTVDRVRVLRPPGTLNFKTDPPKPVETLLSKPGDYDVVELSEALEPFVKAIPKEVQPSTTLDTLGDPPPIDRVIPDPAADLKASPTVTRSDVELAGKGCGFISEALATGGKAFTEPLWQQTMRLASYVTDEAEGRALAHDMSKLHSSYDIDATNKKFNEARKHTNLGWPRCETIERDGCKSCAGCPLKGKILHPFNIIKLEKEKQAAQTIRATTAAMALPDGYVLDRGLIARMVQPKDPDDMPYPQRIFNTALSDPYVTKEPREFHFRTVGDGGRVYDVDIPAEIVGAGGAKLHGVLCRQYVSPYPHCPNWKLEIERFLMAWLQEVERAKTARRRRTFGWSSDEPGFAFAGRLFMPGNLEERSGGIDRELGQTYLPSDTGDLSMWKSAANKLVFNDRAFSDSELLVAASFGAPLMRLTGHPGGLLCAFSKSGTGKSSALRLGASVWCDHRLGCDNWDSTSNGILNKLGRLGDVPMYWDDVAGDGMKHLGTMAMTMSGGAEKTRMTGAENLARKGEWASIAITTSNYAVYDGLSDKNQSNDASHNRILEFEFDGLDGKSELSSVEVGYTLEKLRVHKCVAGIEFGRHLGNLGQELLHTRLSEMEKKVFRLSEPQGDRIQAERVWRAMVAAIITGAELANDTGLAKFHVQSLLTRLIGIMLDCRSKVMSDTGAIGLANTELSAYFQQFARNEVVVNTVAVDGRSAHLNVRMLYSPDLGNGPQQAPLYIRWAKELNLVHIQRAHFWKFLNDRQIRRQPIMKAFLDNFGMPQAGKRARLGTGLGTAWTGGLSTDPVIELHFKEGDALHDRMTALLSGRTDLYKLEGSPNAAPEQDAETKTGPVHKVYAHPGRPKGSGKHQRAARENSLGAEGSNGGLAGTAPETYTGRNGSGNGTGGGDYMSQVLKERTMLTQLPELAQDGEDLGDDPAG